MLVITVTFTIHDMHREVFRDAILANAQTSLEVEKGCRQFDVCQDQSGSVFFLYELYDDDAAFDLHLKSQHFLSFNDASAAWVKDKRVDRFQLLGEAVPRKP
jgi:(4S)-4-hydroxy-5-phosphonooxypentane-2,3-dione isomerase